MYMCRKRDVRKMSEREKVCVRERERGSVRVRERVR